MSSVEELGIFDNRRLVNRLLSDAPEGMSLREFLMNSLEAPEDRFERRVRRVLFAVTQGNKLSILNTGVGLSIEGLKRASEMAYSDEAKLARTDGRNNRGEGAKVSSLRFNQDGLRYRSRLDGNVSQLRLYLSSENIWCREEETPNISEAEALRYRAIEGDFVEVTLLGNSKDHATAMDPYGTSSTPAYANITNEVLFRFYEFPTPPGMSLDIRQTRDFRAGGTRSDGSRAIMSLKELLSTPSAISKRSHPSKSKVRLDDGVEIEYIHFSDYDTSPLNPKSGTGGFAALQWRGELFGGASGAEWGKKVPHYGLMGMGQQVSVLIHLPDDYPILHDGYRKNLQKPSGKIIDIFDFNQVVSDNRPAWLRSIIAKQTGSKKRSHRQPLAKLAQYLEKALKWDKASNAFAMLLAGGSMSRKRLPVKNPRGPHGPKEEDDNRGDKKSDTSRKRSTSSGSKNYFIPTCVWIENNDLDNYPFMHDTAAFWVEESREYVINQDSETFKRFASEVLTAVLEASGKSALGADVTSLAMQEIKDFAEITVGHWILNAYVCAHMNKWSKEKRQEALSPACIEVSLSTALKDSEWVKKIILHRNDVKAHLGIID